MKEENKLYQLVCHISPIIDDIALDELIKKIKSLMAANSVLLISEDDLLAEKISKRKLAYPVKKFKESFYLVVNFIADSQTINNINRQIGLEKNILRHMVNSVKKSAIASREIIDYKATEQIESLSKDAAASKPIKSAKKAGITDKIINFPKKTAKEDYGDNNKTLTANPAQDGKAEIDKLDQKLEEILNQ